MEFALDSLHDLEKEIDGVLSSVTEAAKCGTLKNLNKGHFGKCNKDVVTNLILHLDSVLDKSCCVMRSASAKIDKLKTEQIVQVWAQVFASLDTANIFDQRMRGL